MAHLLEPADGVAPSRTPAPPAPRAAVPRTPDAAGDLLLYALIALLLGGAWLFVQQGYFTAGDDVGYWLGVAGGVMMLLLFSYPLRKHVRWLHRLGKVKWWFLVHMVLGIGGPLLILVHSTFRIGSMNAAVALYSMLVVAGSGVIGRFLFVRINRGLQGEAQTLRQLQARAGLDRSETRSRLAFAPEVEAHLLAFEAAHTARPSSTLQQLRLAMVLPLHQWHAYFACRAALKAPLAGLAQQRSWSATDHAARQRQARRLVRRYLQAVVRVAQFSAYQRLFALWHVAHVPFVYLMVISAVVHVIAVHAY